MAVRAILFDLDGTLLNTLEDIADSMNRALLENGLPAHELNAYKYFVGDGVKTLAMRVTGFREEIAPKVLSAYQAYYSVGCENKTRPYEGVKDMLQRLSSMDLKLCVFSNKPHKDTLYVTARYFPEIKFDAVRGQMEGIPVKPDPTGALEISEQLNIPPDHILYVGDTGVDMTCAANAGMIPVGVLWGFRTREELAENKARHIIAAPGELLDLVK